MNDTFKSELKNAVKFVESGSFKEAILLHHNDTDGLCSGAIINKALQRRQIDVRRFSLEKPYPEALQKIFDGQLIAEGQLVVFADFGSGMLDQISGINKGRYKILVLDHHDVCEINDPTVFVLNPLEHGYSGNDASASVVSYLFAVALNGWNEDLSDIGLLGAVGDGFLVKNELQSLNQVPFIQAQKLKLVSDKEVNLLSGGEFKATQLAASLDALGSIGYFRGGTDIAVKGLIDKDFAGISYLAEPFIIEMEDRFKKTLAEIKIEKKGRVEWFDLGDSFSDYGVKTVGLLCQRIRDMGITDPGCYILGAQRVPKEIPGIGKLEQDIVKVSMRVPPALARKIEAGEAPPLTQILPAATRAVGGHVDACHPYAAATTIPALSLPHLISEI